VYCGGDLILKTEKSIHIQMKEKLIWEVNTESG
jgi:hypothetical protein